MATSALRSRILNNPNFSLDRWAQNRGFPSANAMEAVLNAAIDLRGGGRITDESLKKVLRNYDPAMHAVVRETAWRVNDIAGKHGAYIAENALIIAVTGDTNREGIESARSLIESMQNSQITDGVMQKRAATDDGPASTVSPDGIRATVLPKPEDPNSIRANLLRGFATKTDRPRTEILADAMEATADRKELINSAPSAFSLRDHITVAYDDALVTSEAESIADADVLSDGVAEGEPQ